MPSTQSARFATLLIFALAGVLLLAGAATVLAIQTGVHGRFYHEIRDTQDLTSDVEPPPLYLIDAMLAMQQTAHQADSEPLLARLAKLKSRFEASEREWGRRLPNASEPAAQSLATVLASGHSFFTVVEGELIPALREHASLRVNAALDGPVRVVFEQHRRDVEQLMEVLTRLRGEAGGNARRLEIMLGVIMSAALVALLVAAYGLYAVRAAH